MLATIPNNYSQGTGWRFYDRPEPSRQGNLSVGSDTFSITYSLDTTRREGA